MDSLSAPTSMGLLQDSDSLVSTMNRESHLTPVWPSTLAESGRCNVYISVPILLG